ncbi:MAG: ArnT family glycosyltransferase [Vicinamibacteria bacterium]
MAGSESPTRGDAWRVAGLIASSAAVRIGLDWLIGPSVDESYAVVMSRRLALSYYDHPPFLFWMPGLAARVAGSESPLVVRLPFIATFMGTTWLLYRLGALLFGERTGLWSAVCLNLALFFTLSAAAWVLPDGPLLFWSVAAAYCLARALFGEPPRRQQALWWMGFGLCTGLALLSKYHAVFLLAGAALFLATSSRHRHWARRPEPYLAVALAVLVFLPVILWNATHGWASLRFQGGRAMPLEPEQDTPLLDSILGQAAWMLPWIWIPLLGVLLRALRRGPRDPSRWLLVCLGVGPIVAFTAVAALGRRGLPHWQAPGYFILIPCLGAEVAERLERGEAWTRRWLWLSTVGLACVLTLLVSHVSTGWVSRVAPSVVESGDPTDDLIQWDPVVNRLHRWGYPKPGIAIAAATWADAAKLAYAFGPDVAVGSVGPDPRGFEYAVSQESLVGRDVLLVARRRAGAMEPMLLYAPYFDRITPVGSVRLLRGDREAVTVSVYRGERLLRPVPPGRPR